MQKTQQLNLYSLLLLFFLANVSLAAQSDEVTWRSINTFDEIKPNSGKKIMVKIYTDWCTWCKKMDESTLKDPVISSYIKENYIPLVFNGESKQAIDYQGETYHYVKSGVRGYHELAAKLTDGMLSYPAIVFFDENMEVIQSIRGFQGPTDFEAIITYFAKNMHTKVPWEKYQQSFTPLSRE